jgi:hypothetical protein
VLRNSAAAPSVGHSESFFYSSQQVELFAHLSSGWRLEVLAFNAECRVSIVC